MGRFPIKSVLVVCALVLLCATPLASGRTLAFGDNPPVTEATSAAGAPVSYDDGGFNCLPASGTTFAIGATQVTCDDPDSTTLTVTVEDTTAPVVTPPSSVSVTTGDPSGTNVTYGSASASDAVAGSPAASCSPSSGSHFDPGTTTVTCSATDGYSNTGTATFTVTVTVVDSTPPTVSVPGPITAEAQGPGGAIVPFTVTATDAVDPSPVVTCVPPSGSAFTIGPHAVSCTATDASHNTSSSAEFGVTVEDTTAPVVTPPSNVSVTTGDATGTNVTYGAASASDAVAGSPAASCTPSSGSHFDTGTTTVTCSATDGYSNTGTATFTVTVTFVDSTPPTVSVPGTTTAEATGSGGANVSFTVTASDAVDPAPTVSCSPASGTTFAIGTTSVSCTATDASNNTSAPSTFNVVVRDTTAPVMPALGNITAEATSSSGAAVSYSVSSATDTVDGSVAPSCLPASSSTFHLGSNTVTCTATDAHSNHSSGTFTITVQDTTGPSFTGIPAPISVEANGPTGSFVNFPSIIGVVDLVDGPIAGNPCSPAGGTKFALGTTTVNCNATDAHGNGGHAQFNVIVRDTTPPNLLVPVARSVYATTPTGIPNTVSGIVSFLSAASATDIVDPSPVITNSAPSFLPVGNLTITFGATDWSGNVAYKSVTLIVVPQPPAGTPPLPVPPPPTIPAQVTNVKVTALDGAARIQWNAGGRQVMVTRSTSATRSFSAIGDEKIVYTGTGSSYTDRGLTNGVEYRYVVMAVDAAGNHSAGVAAVIVPRRNLLRSPKDGARIKKAPKLLWAVDPEAQYYNAQLLLNGKKILSVWPLRPAYALKKTWKYEGRKYTLKPGVYTWFVWPGYGARSAVDYGELMGTRTFRIVR